MVLMVYRVRFFRNRIFLFSGFTRNHFMTRVDSHNHTEKRAASKIFVSCFHVFIAGIKGSNHISTTEKPERMMKARFLIHTLSSRVRLRTK